MSIFENFFVKEKPVFTGIARGVGGFGFGGAGGSEVQYFNFTSPATVDLSTFSFVSRVDIFSISAGGTGSAGQPGHSGKGGAGGSGGGSGKVTVYLDAGYIAPFPITIGADQPQTVDGPISAVNSPLTIPLSISNIFTGYTVTAGAQAHSPGSPSGPNAPSWPGQPGFGGAGGIHFASTGKPVSTHPVLPSVTGTSGQPGDNCSPYRTGGTGGNGGSGYGGGGGGGGGGCELNGGYSSGNPGDVGSPGMVVVRVEHIL